MARTRNDLRDSGVPSLVEWLAQQHNNSDPIRSSAARSVGERWPFTNGYNHTRVLKILAAEEDPHLTGLRLLTEDYADQFGLSSTEQFEHVGVISPLVPVASEPCGHIYKSGKGCGRDSIPGAGKCGWHGGSWINESERADMVAKVSEKLVDLSVRSVTVLAELMDGAKSEKVRYDAAVAILDRIGISPVNKVELSLTPKAEDAAEEIRARVLQLATKDGEAVVPGEVTAVTDEPPEAGVGA